MYLYQFPTAAVTNYHKLGNCPQINYLTVLRSEDQGQAPWHKMKVLGFPQGSKETFPCLFQPGGVSCFPSPPQLIIPFHLQNRNVRWSLSHTFSQSEADTPVPLFHLKEPCNYTVSCQVI